VGSRKLADQTHAADSETVTTPSQDKPLPQDSAALVAPVGARQAAGSAVAGAGVEAGAGAAHGADRKELPRCGARSACSASV